MNWTDYIILALVVGSCFLGLMRGLLREVIALVTWVAAVWFAWEYASLLAPYLGGALADEGVRPWAARIIIFIGVVLLGTAIGLIVTHFVRLSIFSGFDRFLGGIFGLLRGAVMIGILVMLCHALRLQDEGWWQRSTLVPYAERIGNVLRALVGERKITAEHSVTASRQRP